MTNEKDPSQLAFNDFGEIISAECADNRHESCIKHLDPTAVCACDCHKSEAWPNQ